MNQVLTTQEPYSMQSSISSSTGSDHENNQNNMNTVVRRNNAAAQDGTSPRDATRRHTIVGCHKNFNLSEAGKLAKASTTEPPSSNHQQMIQPSTSSGPSSMEHQQTSMSTSMDENELNSSSCLDLSDKLSLTLEEIIHIRSVMTKAELEGLPVGVKVKEEVERRKLCFLCLRTRFSLFGQRGVNCKLCDRTVCSKCYSKMRVPRDQFRHVPVALLSPSLLSTPVVSNVPSPMHQLHGTIVEESFSRTLMERLMRPDLERKVGNSMFSQFHQTLTSVLHFTRSGMLLKVPQRHLKRNAHYQSRNNQCKKRCQCL